MGHRACPNPASWTSVSHAVRRSRKWRFHTRWVRTAWRPRRSKSGGTLNHIDGAGQGSNPHRATSSSVSIRSPSFPVGCQPPQLLEPTPQLAPLLRGQLPCPRTGRVLRPSTLVEACLLLSLLLTTPSAFLDQVRGAWGRVSPGTASGPVTSPTPALPNPVPHGAFATACRRGS